MSIREAYRSLYGDLTKLKDTSVLGDPAGGTGDDDEMWQLLVALSEAADNYCGRHFAPITTTKELDGDGTNHLIVPDLLSVTTLKEDEDGDGTYETTWAATDYELYPRHAEPTKHWGHAYTEIRVNKDSEGSKKLFTKGQANFQIAGTWGYRNLTEDAGTTTDNAGYTAAVTTINVATGGGAKLAIGQTIRIGTEDMLITGITTDALTVARGINGTTAAIIAAQTTAVSILRWPAPVERAVLTNAARLWSRAPAFEPFYVDADMDTDVRALLDPYRRIPA